MAFVVRYKPGTAKWMKSYALIIVGAFVIASGYVFFITPHKIVPGGIYGISIVLHYTLGTPVGLTALFFNIPLTIFGIKILGPRFGVKTFVGFILTSLFMDGLVLLYGNIPLVPDDRLLSALYGGAVIGLGVGMLFKAKASCGGTDVIAMMLGKWTGKPLGQLMMVVDAMIVVIGSVIFADWAIPLYSLLTIFFMGKVIDLVLQGMSYDKLALIVAEKHQLIADKITKDLGRGGTFLEARGMFLGDQKRVIFVVLNRRELALLQEFISKHDPRAFVTVLDADEILGLGFKSLKDRVAG
jgi:uncharacterized membrane-anchored protein YitT (DUF2179 family)